MRASAQKSKIFRYNKNFDFIDPTMFSHDLTRIILAALLWSKLLFQLVVVCMEMVYMQKCSETQRRGRGRAKFHVGNNRILLS
jgi:hypothetical protein